MHFRTRSYGSFLTLSLRVIPGLWMLFILTIAVYGFSHYSKNKLSDKEKAPSGFYGSEKKVASEFSDGWNTKIENTILRSEYFVSKTKDGAAWQSPNRKFNLRGIYQPGKFIIKNRIQPEGENWNLTFSNTGIFADGKKIFVPHEQSDVKTSRDTIQFLYSGFTEQYINNENGIRQNFIIHTAPRQTKQLEVKLKTSGLLAHNAGPNEIHFYLNDKNGEPEKKITYNQLACWDADGDKLVANMKTVNGEVIIMVEVMGADFPVTIDPLSTSVNWTTESNQAASSYGFAISTAGDVNGDGYSDVVVGAHLFDNGQSNEGRAFLYLGSATGLSTTASWTAESNQLAANFGYSVNTAGDVNGDGFSDVIVGCHNYDNGQTNEGRAFVYHGSATGLPLAANWTAESDQANAVFGFSVACAGDVNADGFSDVIIGSYLYDNGETDEGRSFIYHGSASGLTAAATWTAESNQASAQFGYSVAGAGDVNGDSFSDVIVGAFMYDNGQADEGMAYIYHGSAAGVNAAAAWTAESNQASSAFSRSVSSAGDVNADGYCDVIVGAYAYNNGLAFEGMVFVYHGSAAGVSAAANWSSENNQLNAQYGSSVACAGDVNGDGYSDVIIGSFLFDGGNINEGKDYVYHGSSLGLAATAAWTLEANQDNAQMGVSVAPAGDVNGDGYSDILVSAHLFDNPTTDEGITYVFHGAASGLNAASSVTIESDQVSSQFGKSVASAGDVNGDGYSDIIVGAPFFDNGEADEGRAFVFHGASYGINGVVSAWTAESNQANAQFGTSVASAGDVNGDGYSDVIVGAPFFDNGQADEGRVYVYHGSAAGLNAAAAWTSESDQVSASYGISVSVAGDVNSDGYSDVIIGASVFDNGQTNEGRTFVFHGSATGLPAAANWTAESDQASAQFGISVSSAGDVNSDGYCDVIIGANLFDNGQADEGRAFVYMGSATGLGGSAAWTSESNQASANFGISVACAGDVNGDAFNDVVIGSNLFDNGQSNEGRAYFYPGSSTGLSSTPTTVESNIISANFGISVASAGDVNGDGYSDIIVGANTYTNVESNEGGAYVYQGGSTGLNTAVAWITEANQASAGYGISVTCAGDVNADGYSDVVVGSNLFDNGQADEGRVISFYGNNGGNSFRNNVRLYNDDMATIINVANLPQSSYGFGLYAKSFMGRQKGTLTWETRWQNTLFSLGGSVITNSTQYTSLQGAYTDLGIAGIELKDLAAKLQPQRKTKVRARIRYSAVTAITGQMYGPWRYSPGYLSGGTIHNSIPLPVELLEFSAEEYGNAVKVNWITASEINSDYFIIERSADAVSWTSIEQVEAAENSNSLISYQVFDENPVKGISYYRLRIVDKDGKISYSDIDDVHFTGGIKFTVYPNPFTNQINVRNDSGAGNFSVRLITITGQEVPGVWLKNSDGWSLHTSGIPSGTYVVLVEMDGKITEKVVVK